MGSNDISNLSLDQVGQIKPLIEASLWKPYRFLLEDNQIELNSLWFDEVVEVLKKGTGEVFVDLSGGEIAGMAVYSELSWETRIFGKRMGALKYLVAHPNAPQKHDILARLLDQTIDWAIPQGIEFLLCKTYADDTSTIHQLENKGFLLMDTHLNYVYNFRRDPLNHISCPPLGAGTTVRLAEENDEEQIIKMAKASFQGHYGRFHADERISNRQATRVYEEWVKSSYDGYADLILVAEIDGIIVGSSIWKNPSPLEQRLGIQLGHHSLGHIHPDYSGKGLFTCLTYAGMKWFDEKADCIEGPLHVNNYPVQRAYTKLRWRICDAGHSFHKWLVE